MENRKKIITALRSHLQPFNFVHALWLEGSIAEKDDDIYSDLDIWLSVDDDMLLSIYDEVEVALKSVAPIDYKYVLKRSGELGHNVYHLKGMNEFLTLDINSQKISRNISHRENVDFYEMIFDKSNVIKIEPLKPYTFVKDSQLAEVIEYINYMAVNIKKNRLRDRDIESGEYYRAVLQRVVCYLRLKNGKHEKSDFGFKHIYKDIPADEYSKLTAFYFGEASDSTLSSLKKWLRSI